MERGNLAARMAAGFVFALLVLGSFALWIVVPAGTVWALSQLIHSTEAHYGAAIIGVPVAMVCFAAILAWLSELHVRITDTYARPEDHWRRDGDRRRAGPLEPLLLISLGVALVGMVGWFFLFAENPLLW
jgi:hypothetical protein